MQQQQEEQAFQNEMLDADYQYEQWLREQAYLKGEKELERETCQI